MGILMGPFCLPYQKRSSLFDLPTTFLGRNMRLLSLGTEGKCSQTFLIELFTAIF